MLQVMTKQLLATLVRNNVPAVGFVNEGRIYVTGETDARIALLRSWLEAGMTLGNHTFSHLRFHDTPLPQYMDDVIHGEVITRKLMRARGLNKFYFRHPYTSTGPTKEAKDKFEAFLRERNYQIAPFTIEHVDWAFNAIYQKARQKQDYDLAQRIRAAYLEYLDVMCNYFERRSREVLGYEVKQILLIHANELNAECMEEMLQRLRRRGYSFITLEEALRDKAYQIRDDYVGPMGISWLHRWTVSLGKEMNHKGEPDPPKFILALMQEGQSR